MPLDNRSLVIPETLQREQAIETALYLGNTGRFSGFSVEAGIRYGFFTALGPKNYYIYDPDLPRTPGTITDSLALGGGRLVAPHHAPEFRISARYAFTGDFSVSGI